MHDDSATIDERTTSATEIVQYLQCLFTCFVTDSRDKVAMALLLTTLLSSAMRPLPHTSTTVPAVAPETYFRTLPRLVEYEYQAVALEMQSLLIGHSTFVLTPLCLASP